MQRTNFFQIVTPNGVEEYDHLNNTLNRFQMNYPVQYYRIVDADVMRSDLISYKAYGTVDYWWIVLFVNNIKNPLTDIVSGDIIKIPNILDIYSFYKQYGFR
jgi:hypothetical protein